MRMIDHRSGAGAPSLMALVCCAFLAGCSGEAPAPQGVTGDAERGKLLLRQYGCGACHTIPGVAAAKGKVGPPLEHVASRVYLAGVLPNTPDNMARWIREPQKIDPQTAMPSMQVPEQHAQDMVAYLYRLK